MTIWKSPEQDKNQKRADRRPTICRRLRRGSATGARRRWSRRFLIWANRSPTWCLPIEENSVFSSDLLEFKKNLNFTLESIRKSFRCSAHSKGAFCNRTSIEIDCVDHTAGSPRPAVGLRSERSCFFLKRFQTIPNDKVIHQNSVDHEHFAGGVFTIWAIRPIREGGCAAKIRLGSHYET